MISSLLDNGTTYDEAVGFLFEILEHVFERLYNALLYFLITRQMIDQFKCLLLLKTMISRLWPISLEDVASVPSLLVLSAIIILLCYHFFSASEKPLQGYPIPTLPGIPPKKAFERHGRALLEQALIDYPDQPFQVLTGTGPRLVFPNKFASDIKHHPHLDFTKSIKVDFFPQYPGFDGPRAIFEDNHARLIQDTVRIRLTQSLGSLMPDLMEETTFALQEALGTPEEWKHLPLRNAALEIVARLSSRAFLGKDLCRDRKWIDIAMNHVTDTFVAARELRMLPAILRPALLWVLPHCTKIRRQVRGARKLISQEFDRRMLEARKAQASGQKPPKTADSISWMVELSKGEPFDVVATQLSLLIGALHTTSEALAHALHHLCQHPEIIEPLREEAARVLRTHGWSKTALHQMKLMDSFLKESQRFHRETWGMQRFAEEEVELSDGAKIPKGCRILVQTKHFDPEMFPEPQKFDAYRFFQKREQPGQDSDWQFISTRSDFLAFGYGRHECPG